MSDPQVRPRMGAGLDVRALMVRLGRAWGWFALFGVVAVAAGIIALVWPGPTLLVLAVVFGVQLVVSGIFRLVAAVPTTTPAAAPER